MGVAVDQAGEHRRLAQVDHGGAGGNGQVRSHRRDPGAVDQDDRVLDRRAAAAVDEPRGPDGDMPGSGRCGILGPRIAGCQAKAEQNGERSWKHAHLALGSTATPSISSRSSGRARFATIRVLAGGFSGPMYFTLISRRAGRFFAASAFRRLPYT